MLREKKEIENTSPFTPLLEEKEYDINRYDCSYFVIWLNCQSCYVMRLQQHASYNGIQ